MRKLAIVTTHPIQYNAPFFKLLTERGKLLLKVFYTWPQAIEGFDDPDFGKSIKWDIPLLEGYDWEAVPNVAKKPSSKKWNGIDCPQLITKIDKFGPDAVMVYGWNLKSHFGAMRHFKGKKQVWFFGDSTLLNERPGWRKVARRIALRWVYRHIDKALYVGTNNKAYFVAHGLKEDQLTFFPHVVDNERFADSKEKQFELKARKWRAELGYIENDIVILFAGKLEPRKNLNEIVSAVINHNSSNGFNVKLLLVGSGPLESNLKLLVNGNSNVKFLPFQNQSIMPVIYRIGDVFCLSSKSETWGLGINEAMACSRPVVASDRVGCAIDLIKDGENGFIFESGDIQGLLAKLSLLRNNEMSLKTMGGNAFNKIQQWNLNRKCVSLEED